MAGAPVCRRLRDLNENVVPFDPHRVARLGIQGRRLQKAPVYHIEDGLMPGTGHPVAAEGAFRQGTAIVRAFPSDGIKFSLEADQQDLGLPHNHLAHFAILKIVDPGNFSFHGQDRLLPVTGRHWLFFFKLVFHVTSGKGDEPRFFWPD